ncbi:MAG: winged helix DNA-binding protein [Rhodospirillaceae bacterium]|nr:winged helix DNA-binding protein [Rhodospirillaceae bacterium]MBT7953935.1 winged helix DNA-binding protein [Rhodospirillaceae bacterium]
METAYVDLAKTIERLHRRFLDVVRAELTRLGYRDLTAVQAMLLTNIGDEEIVIRDLIERGYYQGSNVSYNMKKLVDGGYIEQQRAEHDKRSVRIKLTDKSRDICEKIKDLEARNANALVEEGLTTEEVEQVQRTLKRLERVWGDYIHYGPS